MVSGIAIYWSQIQRSNPKFYYSTVMISWVLISLFPVVLLFSVFVDSSANAEFASSDLGKITVGGAFGAFFVLWVWGTRSSLKAVQADHGEAEINRLQGEVQILREKFEEVEGKVPSRVLEQTKKIKYKMSAPPKKVIGLYTGNIQRITDMDVWVSSENTNMQMARFYDRSISGTIRYLGAKRDVEGNVVEDLISDDLRKLFHTEFVSVNPASAHATTSGKLLETHNVKRIIHVTSVQGEVGIGYAPISNMGQCVFNALQKIDDINESGEEKLRTVVFPLLGVGTAKGDLAPTIRKLFHAALDYFDSNEKSKIKEVYFLAWTDVELNTCKDVLKSFDNLTAN